MKKLFMLVVAAMFATVNVNAQSAGEMYIKPMAGGNLATLTGDVDGANMKLNLVGGAEFVYNISNQFGISAGALFSMQGAEMDDNSSMKDRKSTLTYLNVPILANYYVASGLAIKAGVQPGFLLGRKDTYTDLRKHVDVEYTGTDGMKKLDFSIPFGLSYEFSDFIIDARYNLGLTNIFDTSSVNVKNGVIMLTVGYKIPL